MTIIDTVRLRKVLDSRGSFTVEADVITEGGGFGRASAPAGASTGHHEATSLPAEEAISAAREQAVPYLEGRVDAADQRAVDAALRAADGTDTFAEIGANSAVAISMAAAHAGADVLTTPLFQHLGGTFKGHTWPIPLGNVLGGGEHAVGGPSIQEFLAVPYGAPNVTDAIAANAAVHAFLREALPEYDASVGLGDEGAWAPAVDTQTALSIMDEATATVADQFGFSIGIGLDVAATEQYDADADTYTFDGVERTTDEHREWLAGLIEDHDIRYVEDPFDEEAFDAFARLTARVDDSVTVCGDDLFVTAADRVQTGIDHDAATAVLIKPNQIGTLSGAIDAVDRGRTGGLEPVVSHRSGETTDATIAHLAVAVDAPYIKTGAIGGERTAKLNELIRISTNAT